MRRTPVAVSSLPTISKPRPYTLTNGQIQLIPAPEKGGPQGTHLVLEEVVIEVALEPLAEGGAAGLPPDAVGELQRAAHHQGLRALAREVHLDDLRQRRGGSPQGQGSETWVVGPAP